MRYQPVEILSDSASKRLYSQAFRRGFWRYGRFSTGCYVRVFASITILFATLSCAKAADAATSKPGSKDDAAKNKEVPFGETVSGLAARITPLTGDPGAPFSFKIELKNVSDKPVMGINFKMENMWHIKFRALDRKLEGEGRVDWVHYANPKEQTIQPNETAVIALKYDAALEAKKMSQGCYPQCDFDIKHNRWKDLPPGRYAVSAYYDPVNWGARKVKPFSGKILANEIEIEVPEKKK